MKKGRLGKSAREKIIGQAINNMREGDRHPRDIIEQDYGGNQEAYCRIAAAWLGIRIQKTDLETVSA